MKTNYFKFSLSKLPLLLSLIVLTRPLTLQPKPIQTDLDQRARALFGETSKLTNLHHLVNSNSYLYTLEYESGLSVTFELIEKAIFISKEPNNTIPQLTQRQIQSQAEVTMHLIKLKEINSNYTAMFFVILNDGYLIQYQWQNNLYTYELNWDLKIRRKAIRSLLLPNTTHNHPNSIFPNIVPLSTPTTDVNSSSVQSSQQYIKNEIVSYLTKGPINLLNGSKIETIMKIGNTNNYRILTTVSINQKNLSYQLIAQYNAIGLKILDGNYNIDFIPSYQQMEIHNQTLYDTIDLLVRRKLARIIAVGAQLSNVWKDEPFYKFNYSTPNTDYEVDFIYDSILQRINITRIIVLSDADDIAADTSQTVSALAGSHLQTSYRLHSPSVFFPSGAERPTSTTTSPESQRDSSSQSSKPSAEGDGQSDEQPFNITRISRSSRSKGQHRTLKAQQYDTSPSESFSNMAATTTGIDTADILSTSVDSLSAPIQNETESNPPLITDDLWSTFQPLNSFSPIEFDASEESTTQPLQSSVNYSFLQNGGNEQSAQNSQQVDNTSSLPMKLQVIQNLIPFSQQQLLNIIAFLQSVETSVSFSNAKVYLFQKFVYGFRIVLEIDKQYTQFIIGTFSSETQYELISIQNLTQQQAETVDQFSQMVPIDLNDHLQTLIMKTLPKTNSIRSITQIHLRLQPDGLYYQILIEVDSGNSYLLTLYSKPQQNFAEVLTYEQITSHYYMSPENLTQLTETPINPTLKQSATNDLVSVLDFVSKKFGTNFTDATVISISEMDVAEGEAKRYEIKFKSQSGVYYQVTVILANSPPSIILLKYVKLYDGYSLLPRNSSKVSKVIQFFTSTLKQRVNSANPNEFQIENVLMREVQLIGKFYKLVLDITNNFEIVVFEDIQGTMTIYGIDGIPPYYTTLLGLSYTPYGNLATLIQNLRSFLAPSTTPAVPLLPKLATSQPPPPSQETPPSTPTMAQLKAAKQPFSSLPSMLPVSSFPPPFFPSSSTISFARGDFFCLKSVGSQCISCVYRYFPKDGKCVTVQNQCSTYDNNTGECLSCYMGYFLINGNCSQLNILCYQADSKGNCIKCYNDFTLRGSQCYNSKGIESATFFNLPTDQMDPLCQQYSKGICISCTTNCYMSNKLSRCAIKDPNSLTFDTVNQASIDCVRGYAVSPSGKCIKTN